jgi:ribonuclease HII
MSSSPFPTTEVERSLGSARYIIGIDEVGRGAIAGPVAVGAFILDLETLDESKIPAKLQDSKLMTERNREAVFEELSQWVPGFSVGFIEANLIDENGIVWSLAQAAVRALEQLSQIPSVREAIAIGQVHILLDGSHNWLESVVSRIPVTVRPKADRDCVSVAAAACLAKVTRDRLMVKLAENVPGYLLEGHKGYASAAHIEAVRRLGPSAIHRVSWLTKIISGE